MPGRLIDLHLESATTIWPTPLQLQLLRAALWSGAEARAAWDDWRARADLPRLDLTSWKLLPLAWRNLRAQGAADPVLDDCAGFYRFHWANNQVLIREAARLVRAWQDLGIPVVLLKGVPLLVDVYGDAGARPMSDVDLLVPVDRAREAGAWLQRDGWVRHMHLLDWDAVPLEGQHSYNWKKGRAQIDLHWHVESRNLDPAVTAGFWARARPFTFHGVATRQLCPEHTLLEVCSHGVDWQPVQVLFRWMADAHWLLRRHGDGFDWDELVRMGARTGTTLALRHGLEFAAAEVRLPVPAGVLAALRARRVPWVERMEFRRSTTPGQGGRLGRAWNLLRLLWRVAGRGPLHLRWRRVSQALCRRWGATSLAQAAWCALRKAVTGDRATWLDRPAAGGPP